jgi:hypothetical protein
VIGRHPALNNTIVVRPAAWYFLAQNDSIELFCCTSVFVSWFDDIVRKLPRRREVSLTGVKPSRVLVCACSCSQSMVPLRVYRKFNPSLAANWASYVL